MVGTVGDGQKNLGVAKSFWEGGQNLTCVIIKHVDLVLFLPLTHLGFT